MGKIDIESAKRDFACVQHSLMFMFCSIIFFGLVLLQVPHAHKWQALVRNEANESMTGVGGDNSEKLIEPGDGRKRVKGTEKCGRQRAEKEQSKRDRERRKD